MRWPRKHQYRQFCRLVAHNYEMAMHRCSRCGKTTMMEPWQLSKLPWTAARCPVGRHMWPWEALHRWLGGLINCWVPTDKPTPTLH